MSQKTILITENQLRLLEGVIRDSQKLPDNKYQHFINEFASSKRSLLAYFLRNTRFEKDDFMPMSKGQINYVRWHRTYDNETGQYRNIMRNYSKPIVNFYFLNNLLHLFLYAGVNNPSEEGSTYGHYEYNPNSGILQYKISRKKKHYKNKKGEWRTILGSGDKIMSSVQSPKGIYSPMNGIHKKVYKYGNRFNQYFRPEAALYNAKGEHTGYAKIKNNDQLQHYLFPVEDKEDDGKLEKDFIALTDSIFSNFNGNNIEMQISYALFLAFLLGEYNGKIDGFALWKDSVQHNNNRWRSEIRVACQKIIDEYEKGYQEKKRQESFTNNITNEPHEVRDPEPKNSTPEQIKAMKSTYDELYGKEIGEGKQKADNIIKESINRFLIKEGYIGNLYHFTSLGLAYDIMKDNIIYSREDSSQGQTDRRMHNYNDPKHIISLSRTGVFGQGFEKNLGISVRFTLDGEKLSSSLRGNRIHPYYYGGFEDKYRNPKFNPEDTNSMPFLKKPRHSVTRKDEYTSDYQAYSEFEERLYGNDISPLNEYCTRIDILIRSISSCDDSEILSDEEYDYVPTYNYEAEHDAQVNKQVIGMMMNMPLWKGKLFVHNKDKRVVPNREIEKTH